MNADTFFKEFQRLISSLPRTTADIFSSVDCDYGNKIYNSRNLFNCFDCVNCTDCSNCYDSFMCVNCTDCDYCVECELCYECNDGFKCYDGSFLDRCANLRNSDYCSCCIGCNDLFGCVNLSNKKFCLFNRQLSEGEYRQKVKELKQLPAKTILDEIGKLQEVLPITQTNEGHNVNTVYGDYIFYNTNCYLCFDAAQNNDSSYLYDSFHNKHVFDATYSAYDELSYEVVDASHLFNCDHVINSSNCSDASYICRCTDVKNSLGCVGLMHKQYCFLNRQLNKDEYEKQSKEILSEIKQVNPGWSTISY